MSVAAALPLGAVLAHQGGWDEILMVLTPVALFAGLLWLANSRAKQVQADRASTRSATPSSADPSDPPGPGGSSSDPPDPEPNPAPGRDPSATDGPWRGS